MGNLGIYGQRKYYDLSGESVPFGNAWYVDSTNGATTGDGKTWDTAMSTIALAVAAASANDSIYIAPGDYIISEAIAIATAGLRLVGPNESCNDYRAFIYSSAACDLITVDANQVSITGLGLSTVGGDGNCITISGTANSYKCYIARCRFDGIVKQETELNVIAHKTHQI